MNDSDDSDKTLIRPTANRVTGSEPTQQLPPRAEGTAMDPNDHALPIGTRIHEFEIKKLIGIGGFGIVYLAHDQSLGREVALKEYMPSTLAARTGGITVGVKSARETETFNAGLNSFMNEARLLAQFDHPSLVKVYRFWKENGTAYMVMPFIQGRTLKQELARMGTPPTETWLKDMLGQLMDALAILHRENCYHRDIAPDNILLLGNGRPVLLDFGAARHVISDMAQALTVIVKPGYAPIEQYSDISNVQQGAWTDIYALGALAHYAIMGKPPMPSVGRLVNDTQTPLVTAAFGRYSEDFLAAIDRSLSLMPQYRPQSIAEFRQTLGLEHTAASILVAATIPEPTVRPAATATPSTPMAPAVARPFNKLWLVGGLVALLLMAASFWLLQGRGKKTVTPAPEAARAPAVTAEPIAPPSLPTPPPPVATPVVAPPVLDAITAMNQLFDARNTGQTVLVDVAKPRLKIGVDTLRFRVKSSIDGYLYVFLSGTDGGPTQLLFPNDRDKIIRIEKDKVLDLPRNGSIPVNGPAGTDQFVVMVSPRPRDFSASGLVNVGGFGEFPNAGLERAARENPAQAAVLAGKPVCNDNAACTPDFGAARFSVIEFK